MFYIPVYNQFRKDSHKKKIYIKNFNQKTKILNFLNQSLFIPRGYHEKRKMLVRSE